MNDEGLAIGWLWQSNMTFHSRCGKGLQPSRFRPAAGRRQVPVGATGGRLPWAPLAVGWPLNHS